MKTKETQHTPGPWEAKGRAGAYYIEPENGYAVARILDNCPSSESGANARLIAAAPDLLDTLRRVENAAKATGDYIGQDGQLIKAVRAAITKAEGR